MQYAKRPWGFWINLIVRGHFKVKLICFKKGGKLSMQKHQYRDELWCFLSGWGYMISENGTRRFTGKGNVFNISRQTWHQYIALKKTWVLEIQSGAKCEETDIERKDD